MKSIQGITVKEQEPSVTRLNIYCKMQKIDFNMALDKNYFDSVEVT